MYFNRDTGASGAGVMKQSQSYYSNMQVVVKYEMKCLDNWCFPPRPLTWTMWRRAWGTAWPRWRGDSPVWPVGWWAQYRSVNIIRFRPQKYILTISGQIRILICLIVFLLPESISRIVMKEITLLFMNNAMHYYIKVCIFTILSWGIAVYFREYHNVCLHFWQPTYIQIKRD